MGEYTKNILTGVLVIFLVLGIKEFIDILQKIGLWW